MLRSLKYTLKIPVLAMLRKSTLVTLTCVSRSQTLLVDAVLELDIIARHRVQEQKHVIGRAVSGKNRKIL
jgi:hypothetical protein